MGHLGAEVEYPLAGIKVVEVLGEGLPAPLDAVGQGRPGDVLDAFHQLDQEVAPIRGGRREADTAVAHHRRGDAVPSGRCELGVPGRLRVVVGVRVDEPGGDEAAVGVDLASPGADIGADLRDRLAVDGDVGGPGRSAGTVDDLTVADDEIVHDPIVGDRRAHLSGVAPLRMAAGDATVVVNDRPSPCTRRAPPRCRPVARSARQRPGAGRWLTVPDDALERGRCPDGRSMDRRCSGTGRRRGDTCPSAPRCRLDASVGVGSR